MSDSIWASLIQALSAVAAAAIAGYVTVLLARISVLKAQRETYRSIADDQDRVLAVAVDKQQAAEGRPAVLAVADVAPEHSSPVTETSAIAAHQQSLRARVTAAALLLDVPPRSSPPAPSSPATVDAATLTVEAAKATLKAAEGDADKGNG